MAHDVCQLLDKVTDKVTGHHGHSSGKVRILYSSGRHILVVTHAAVGL